MIEVGNALNLDMRTERIIINGQIIMLSNGISFRDIIFALNFNIGSRRPSSSRSSFSINGQMFSLNVKIRSVRRSIDISFPESEFIPKGAQSLREIHSSGSFGEFNSVNGEATQNITKDISQHSASVVLNGENGRIFISFRFDSDFQICPVSSNIDSGFAVKISEVILFRRVFRFPLWKLRIELIASGVRIIFKVE